jgi:hypothetical protein
MTLIQRNRRAKAFFLGGVFLACMCPLMLQVMETRLLSVIAWYYLAFFAISMAMFGMTAGSLFVYFKSELFSSERLQEYLGCITVALAISVVFSTVSLVSSVVLSGLSGGTMLLWLKLILSILPPYVFAGMAISLALTRSPWPVGQVYRSTSGCRFWLPARARCAHLDGWRLRADRDRGDRRTCLRLFPGFLAN